MKLSHQNIVATILILWALAFSTMGVTPVYAATVTVTDCSAPSGAAGRLVEVITAAAPGDTVNFSCSGTITLTATILIDKDLTIDGSGQTVTISGGNAVRVFITDVGVTVTLNQLTISNGSVTGPGGGIYNQGPLTISNSTISGNSATTGGGGIFSAGSLTITGSTISGNSAPNGGGIYNYSGAATLTNSVISGNSAPTAGGGLYNNSATTLTVSFCALSGNNSPNGAGIYNRATLTVSNSAIAGNTGSGGVGIYNNPGAALTVTNSTFSGNSGTNGGGILNRATASVTNSTFSGNTVTNRGGAIMGLGGVLTLINSTLSGNTASNAADGGGGFYGSGTLNFSNTIIANSTSVVECYSSGTIGTNLNNLVEDGSCLAALSGDPNLGALTNNGGPTQTFAPLVGSAAIDAGNAAACPSADQRGATRPTDGDASGSAACDIGALELGGLQCGIQSAAEPTDYMYLSNVNLQVTDDGTNLDCLRVTDIPYNHPNATNPLKTGKYWQILGLQADQTSAAGSDFSVNLTLPFGAADADDKLCRYTGSGWDCAASGYVANTSITRNSIAQFSDWTIGDNSGPTAINLARLSASSPVDVPGLWLVIGSIGMLALGGLLIGYRTRRTHQS